MITLARTIVVLIISTVLYFTVREFTFGEMERRAINKSSAEARQLANEGKLKELIVAQRIPLDLSQERERANFYGTVVAALFAVSAAATFSLKDKEAKQK